ncbi:hypothetical protein LCGC14_1103190 [marine sediment metagenome]|uniref:Uncharacterized protein n=1 Tax=marine sediment metagenome TaxID=412755 RepID=A0A0F9QF53_9ZZZZ
MQVTLGKDGLTKTHQAIFPETVTIPHRVRANEDEICDGEARIAFVAHEGSEGDGGKPFVCGLHENKYHEGEAWLHDCCAVAVFFCKKCLTPVALYNQG